jgi:hypothetical protein
VKLDPAARNLPWLVLAASLLACFGVWHWAETILLPSNTLSAQTKGIPIGNNSDLYPRWLGARESLLRGRDPYSAEMTREMQVGFYGRPLDPKNLSDPKDQVAFAYPLYVIFLLAPTVALPFQTVLAIFKWLVLLSLAASVPLWMYAIGLRTRLAFTLSGMVLAVSSSAAISGYHLQNLAVLVVLMLAAAAAAVVRGWLVLGGFLLALSTIKPQLSGLFVLFFMLWAAADWARRQRLFWSFSVSLLALVLAAEKVSSGWMGRFLAAIRAYETYAADPSILQVLLPSWLARLVAAAFVAFLVVCCWRWRKSPAGTEQFGWALAWVASVTLVVIPKLAAYNQPILIPALLVLLAHRGTIWKTGLLPRALAKGVLMCLMWQWVTAVILSLASFLVPVARILMAAGVPQYTLFALPSITLLAVVAATFSLRDTRLSNQRTPAVHRG